MKKKLIIIISIIVLIVIGLAIYLGIKSIYKDKTIWLWTGFLFDFLHCLYCEPIFNFAKSSA